MLKFLLCWAVFAGCLIPFANVITTSAGLPMNASLWIVAIGAVPLSFFPAFLWQIVETLIEINKKLDLIASEEPAAAIDLE